MDGVHKPTTKLMILTIMKKMIISITTIVMNNNNNDDVNSDDCNSTESHNNKLRQTNSMTTIHNEQLCTDSSSPQICDEVQTWVMAIQWARTVLIITIVITAIMDNKMVIMAMNTIPINTMMIRATKTEPWCTNSMTATYHEELITYLPPPPICPSVCGRGVSN